MYKKIMNIILLMLLSGCGFHKCDKGSTFNPLMIYKDRKKEKTNIFFQDEIFGIVLTKNKQILYEKEQGLLLGELENNSYYKKNLLYGSTNILKYNVSNENEVVFLEGDTLKSIDINTKQVTTIAQDTEINNLVDSGNQIWSISKQHILYRKNNYDYVLRDVIHKNNIYTITADNNIYYNADLSVYGDKLVVFEPIMDGLSSESNPPYKIKIIDIQTNTIEKLNSMTYGMSGKYGHRKSFYHNKIIYEKIFPNISSFYQVFCVITVYNYISKKETELGNIFNISNKELKGAYSGITGFFSYDAKGLYANIILCGSEVGFEDELEGGYTKEEVEGIWWIDISDLNLDS